MTDNNDNTTPPPAPAAAASNTNNANSFDDATIAQAFHAMEQLTTVFGFDSQVAQAAVEAVGTDVTAAYNWILDSGQGKDAGGPIVPIMDCPHVQYHVKIQPPQLPSPQVARCDGSTNSNSRKGHAKSETQEDGMCPPGENWVCLQCGVVRCSRYINGHGVMHYEETLLQDAGPDSAGHCIAASLADLSVWCHACSAYLRHAELDPLIQKLEELKFGPSDAEEQEEEMAEASTRTIFSDSSNHINDLDGMGSNHIPSLSIGDVLSSNHMDGEGESELDYPFGERPSSLQDVARFIQSEKCRSIVVLAGAGMSVTSGIPDYRSAGGLYHTLQPDALTATEIERAAIRVDPTVALEQGMFLHNPLPCLEVKRPFILGTQEELWKATVAHRFVELLHSKTGKLTRLYTQNIDGLEGQCHDLSRDKVVAVHGSMDRAECAYCGATSDFAEFCNKVRTNIKDVTGQDPTAPPTSTPIQCQMCGHNTVKPAIVLFRSKLPEEFFDRVPQDIPGVDLLIVIGTSLAVAPANTLCFRIPQTALRVVINDEPVGWRVGIEYGPHAKRDYFAQGHCDDVTLDLIEQLGWLDELAAHVDDLPAESAERVRHRLSVSRETTAASDEPSKSE